MKKMRLVAGFGLVLGIVAGCGGNATAPSAGAQHSANDGHDHGTSPSAAKCEHGADAATCEKCKAEGHNHSATSVAATKCEHGIDAAICADCAKEGHAHDTGTTR